MGGGQHGRLLQPDQHALRHNHRVLHRRTMCHYVSRPKIWIPLGRRADGQEAHQVFGAEVHRLPDDLGARSTRWRDSLSHQNRSAFMFCFSGRGTDKEIDSRRKYYRQGNFYFACITANLSIECCVISMQSTVSCHDFPSFSGVHFPKNFVQIAKTILKRLFRVYAHIYHQHFRSVYTNN